MISAAARRAGRTSGMVTRRKVCTRVAPLISDDSSSEGSVDRNAATMKRKTIGERCRPSTQIIPQIVKMSTAPGPKIGSSTLLTRPISGLARKIQAIV